MDEYDDIEITNEENEGGGEVQKKIKKLRDDLKKTREERDEYLAGWQRSKADYVNLSRRTREEREALIKNTTTTLSRSIIYVYDSVEAALVASRESTDRGLVSGIEHIKKQLEQTLSELGIERFSPAPHDPFDPSIHEPIRTVASSVEEEDNTVHETLQSGFKIGDSVIRPARVVVTHYQK